MSSPPTDDRRPSLTSLLQDPTQPYIPSPTPSQSILNTPQMKASDPPSNLTPLSPLQGRPGAAAREGSSSSASRPVSGKGTGGKPVILGKSVFGRAPWFDERGKSEDCYVIGVAGGSASGKTSLAKALLSHLSHISQNQVLILSQDSFYHKHTEEELKLAYASEFDFDHPRAIDFQLFREVLEQLRAGKSAEIPIYSFLTHSRLPETQYVYGASVIIVEGILALQDDSLRDLFDLKVFVNCDTDLMLARRIRRDVEERGRDVNGILDQYLRFVKPSYDTFVLPSSRHADIIVPSHSNNSVATDLIVTHIRRQLSERSIKFRSKLSSSFPNPTNPPDLLSTSASSSSSPLAANDNLILLPSTPGLRALLTTLHSQATGREEFISSCDRLSTLIVERALALLPYEERRVVTPLGEEVVGVDSRVEKEDVVGVSVARSGGPLEHGLRRAILDARLGSLLIQIDQNTQEPLLYNTFLPAPLKSKAQAGKSWVLLLDSQMGTGASALMAIRVLRDHHVPEDQILFLTFIVTPQALHAVRRAFPLVKIITSTVASSGLEQVTHAPQSTSSAPASSHHRQRSTSSRVMKTLDRVADGGSGGHTPRGERGDLEGEMVHMAKEWVVKGGFGDIGDRYYTV